MRCGLAGGVVAAPKVAEEVDYRDERTAARILIIGSASAYAHDVARFLTGHGFEVVTTDTIGAGLEQLDQWVPDVVLIEVHPQGRGGLDACRCIVGTWDIPVILMGTKTDELEVVLGLEIGAADYFTKPYRFWELEARLRAVLRRSTSQPSGAPGWSKTCLAVGPMALDLEGRRLFVARRLVNLSRREFDLLTALASPPGVVRTREELIDRVWSGVDLADTRTLDKHIRRLRSKIERDPSNPQYLVTVHSVGYCLHGDRTDRSGL